MKTASQVNRLDARLSAVFSKSRFAVTRLALKGDWIRIHLVNVGGRTYIRDLTDPIDDLPHDTTTLSWSSMANVHMPFLQVLRWTTVALSSLWGYRTARQLQSLDHRLNGSKYLAVKSDGSGIIDIEFGETEGRPDWILESRTATSSYGLSKIKYANVQDLIMVSDVCGPSPLFGIRHTDLTLPSVLEMPCHRPIKQKRRRAILSQRTTPLQQQLDRRRIQSESRSPR